MTAILRRLNRVRTPRTGLIAATVIIAITCALFIRSVQADYIVTLEQVGPNVVATGSGAIDLTGLAFNSSGVTQSFISPSLGEIVTGPTIPVTVDGYTGFSGPTSFGPGFGATANSGSGDFVGIIGAFGFLLVPSGYVSGHALSDSSTYNSATFSSLGVTPGTYEWTWGTGPDQKFTLQIGTVPDSGSTLGLLFLALIALFGVTRFRLA